MQTRHVPRIDSRYWSAIIFASIFGTNLGDFYAHGSGLGLGLGLVVLAALFATTYFAETKDGAAHETYYWLAIVIIRTGATNIADYLAFRLRIPALPLALVLAALIGVLAWYGITFLFDKFDVPTVWNGKVILPSYDGRILVLG